MKQYPAYPSYKVSGVEWIGDVPNHWIVSALGYRSNMIVPMRDKPKSFDGDIPWIRIEDFNGKFISGSKSGQKVSSETVKKMNLKVFPVGTVLCSCSCSMGATAIVSAPLISNQTFIGIVPQKNLCSDFLYYQIQASTQSLNALGTGAIQKYLSRSDFEHFRLSFPPLPEQRAIAVFLDRKTAQIDELIAKKQRQIELLEEQRTALINQAVTKGLDPTVPMKDSGIKWLGEIPSHWELPTIGRMMSLGRGRVISHIEIGDNPGPYPVYSSQTKDDGIMGHLNTFDFEGEYVTWTTDGAHAGRVFYRNGKFNCTNVCGTMSPKTNKVHLPYLPYVMNLGTKYYVRYDINPKLMNGEMSQINFSLPPIEEQKAIVNYLQNISKKIQTSIMSTKKQIQLLQEYRTALISAAVTGKIDVRNSRDDVQ